MGTIRSIIIFNGGSAGDFLKSVCAEQIEPLSWYQLEANGSITPKSNYFKDLAGDWYLANHVSTVDFTKVGIVENSHFFHECYCKISNNLFYIDYDLTAQDTVVSTYIKKQFADDRQAVLDHHISHVPVSIRNKINPENIQKVISTTWQKNLKLWRSISALTAINLGDLFHYSTLVPVVEKIIQHPLTNPDALQTVHQAWLASNSDLTAFYLNH